MSKYADRIEALHLAFSIVQMREGHVSERSSSELLSDAIMLADDIDDWASREEPDAPAPAPGDIRETVGPFRTWTSDRTWASGSAPGLMYATTSGATPPKPSVEVD